MDMTNFYVVLGMDWLVEDHFNINCYAREVGVRFKFRGFEFEDTHKVISTLKVTKLISLGEWGWLANIVDTRSMNISYE